MRDTHEGERIIKGKSEVYLPMTSGQRQDGVNTGQTGRLAYDSYKDRSSFPDLVRSAVEAMVGVMHHKPPVIQLPASMEPMLNMATLQGESLFMLLRRINEQQLISGRIGLLLDVPDGAVIGTKPYIASYVAESILNWDDGRRGEPVAQNLNFVSLNESENVRLPDFEWEFKNKFRVLILGDPEDNEAKGAGVYRVGLFDETGTTFNESSLITPSIGGRTLDKIPFVFINSKDIVPEPDAPPLLGLAQLALTIYRGEADYRQALFMQGQDTLVVVGSSEDAFRTGANASISLPIGGSAEFIGVDSSGLAEMREALQNDKAQGNQHGGQLLDSVSRAKESGDALKIRVAARTATLNQIALSGAFGLEMILKMAAEWTGANPEEVIVTPNLDFADDELSGRTLVEYMTAKSLGAPLSLKSIHLMMQERDLTQMEFDEEIAEIEAEKLLLEDALGNEDEGPVEDEDEEEEPLNPVDQGDGVA
ncbi:MAG: DUF4055 domain-containing protein [Dehalococcoidia bacterium]